MPKANTNIKPALVLYNVKIPLATVRRMRSYSARVGISQSLLLRRFVEQLPGKGKPRIAKVDITAPAEPKATKKKVAKVRKAAKKTVKRARRVPYAPPIEPAPAIVVDMSILNTPVIDAALPISPVVQPPLMGHAGGAAALPTEPVVVQTFVDTAPIEYAPDVPPQAYTEEAPGLEDYELDPITEARAAAE